jgi:hypothetical protein
VAEELQQTGAIAILDAEDRETVMYCLRKEAGLLIATRWGRADWWVEQSLVIRGLAVWVGSQRYGAVRYNAGGGDDVFA